MSKKKYYQFLIVLAVIVFTSCKSRESKYSEDEPILNIDVRNGLNQKDNEFFLSDFANNIKYIPLETNDSCLLSNISYLCLTQENIFISDTKVLYQFDENGRFIRQIGKIGRGPGEHGSRIKFAVDELNNEIYILSDPSFISVYNFETGKFIRNFDYNFQIASFEVFSHSDLVLFTKEFNALRDISSLNDVYLSDNLGNLIDSIPDKERLKNRNNVAGYVHLYKNYQELFYMGTFKNILYRLDEGLNKIPYVNFNLDNKISWEELIIEPNMGNKLDDFIIIYKPLENLNYFFLTIQIGVPQNREERVLRNMLYNKKSGELFPTIGFINDVDMGMTFWPQFINQNKMIGFYQAFEIIDFVQSNKETINFSNKFLKLIDSLKIEDNPVLVIVE
jgi:hypothetical protein